MLTKETLEEAAKKLYPTSIDSFTDTGIDLSEKERLIFINGAKWQAERMYSEEEVLELLNSIQNQVSIDYNDEFMFAEEWFEQFKKK